MSTEIVDILIKLERRVDYASELVLSNQEIELLLEYIWKLEENNKEFKKIKRLVRNENDK